jgi:hypothetical protein
MDSKLFDSLTAGDFYTRFFAFCRSFGVERVNVEYSGGGDSGGPDGIGIHPENQSKIAKYIREELEEELSNPIYNRHGSFADGGGYSVNGNVVYDVTNNQAWIEGTDHNYSYDDEGEETDSSDEEWEETLFSAEDSVIYDRDYTFAFAYCKIKNEKLPTVEHNKMAAAAIVGDETAKEYMAWLENKK